MQYALLIYRQPDDYDAFSDEERKAVSAEYYAIRDDSRFADLLRMARFPASPARYSSSFGDLHWNRATPGRVAVAVTSSDR